MSADFPECWRPAGSDFEKEMALLKRRWGKFLRLMEGSETEMPMKFEIDVWPSDPDFTFELEGGLTLSIVLPRNFPLSPFEISVLNENLTSSVRACLENAIRAYAGKQDGLCALRVTLRWIAQNMQLLFECALEVSAPARPKTADCPVAQSSKTKPSQGASADGNDISNQKLEQKDGDPAATAASPWTPDEQQALEQALRSVPQVSIFRLPRF